MPMFRFGAFLSFRCFSSALIGAVAVLAGCEKQAEIAHYQVPKEAGPIEPTAAAETDINSEPTDRMLTAIVPHDGQAWFFKLAGPIEAVDKQAEAFESFVKTVSFPQQSGGKPQWKLPEGWEQKPGGANLRFATITIPADAKPLDLTVSTPLPWKKGDEKELVDNVNRWRGQLLLPPVGKKDAAGDTHALKLSDSKTDAIIVDLKGRLKAGGMTAPFAGKAAGELPLGHPAVAASGDEKKTAAASPSSEKSAAQSQTPPPAANQPDLPLSFEVPKGWQATKPPVFAIAGFKAAPEAGQVDISISPMGGPAGGLSANVNRWRGQVKLPAVGDDELASMVHPLKVGGLEAQMVRLVGPEGAADRKAIEAAIVPQGEVTWFIKIMGPAAAVDHEQANFEKFLDSIKFRGER